MTILRLFIFYADNWTPLFGNLPKFLLGIISIGFMLTYMIQHWVVYRGRDPYDEVAQSPYSTLPDRKTSGSTTYTSSTTDISMSPIIESRPSSLRLLSSDSSQRSLRPFSRDGSLQGNRGSSGASHRDSSTIGRK